MKKRRSPLRDKPLRNPGQSTNERLHDLYYNKAMPYFIYITVLILFVLAEWSQWHLNIALSPYAYTALAIPLIAFCVYKLYGIHGEAGRIKQGRDGERAVGQYFDRHLREQGCHVFHDVMMKNCNIDHVIVCERGVFTVETKTCSKPRFGKSEIIYKGRSIIINGYHDHKIFYQAREEARWLKSFLSSRMRKELGVKPVVVFPDWYVNNSQGDMKDVWVLNQKALLKFIANKPKALSSQEKETAADKLSEYIRSKR